MAFSGRGIEEQSCCSLPGITMYRKRGRDDEKDDEPSIVVASAGTRNLERGVLMGKVKQKKGSREAAQLTRVHVYVYVYVCGGGIGGEAHT